MIHNPEEEAALHIGAEIVALTVAAPVSAYIAYSNPQLPGWQRTFLYAMALGTIIVDGYLLGEWLEDM